MSRLLLAKAARVCGWPPERWRDGWPTLLTAHEIARLEAPDNRETERAILGLFMQDPPPADGTMPGFSIMTVGRNEYGERVGYTTAEGSPLPTYKATTYRDWPARDWEPSPLIAAWFDARAPQDAPTRAESQSKPETRQTEINRWLRDTWEDEGRPGGAAFFGKLKGYKRKSGSPIREWYQAGKDAGIEYETSAGARGELSRHAIQNKVSEWKGKLKQTAAPSNP